jgi:response regulator of citrate/malate metabolism
MIRTLVVEDDPIVLDVNSGYLKWGAGFVVVCVARSGGEAVATAAGQPVDLILLDFYLPDISGLDVCRVLRAAHTPPIDIIAVTAAHDADTVRAAIPHGVVQYLIKPYSFASSVRSSSDMPRTVSVCPVARSPAQSELDQMMNTLRGSTNIALPKRAGSP